MDGRLGDPTQTSNTYRMPFGPWKVLRNRDFALVWTFSALSDIGTWMQIGAMGIYVTQATGEARWTGIASAITYLTAGACAPLGGVLADRFNRKSVLFLSFSLQSFFGFVLAFAFASGIDAPLPLIALAGMQGAMTAAVVPALNAMIPDIVPKDRVANAAFLDQIAWNFGRAIGPPIAVIVIHAQSFTAVFVINAISYAAVALCIPFLRARQERHFEDGSMLRRLRVGWHGLINNKICLYVTLVAMIEMAVISPYIALIPAMGQIALQGTEATSAALFTAQGIGSAIGAIVIGSVMHRYGQGRTLVALAWTQPFLLVSYAFSPNLAYAIVLIVVLSGVHTAVFALGASVVQQYAEPHLRGRIVAFSRAAMVTSYGILSSALGLVATNIGLRETYLLMALVTLASMALLTVGSLNRLTHIKDFDRVIDVREEEPEATPA